MRTRGHSAGFTLLEMLVVLAIIAAASLLAMAAFNGGMRGMQLRSSARDIAAQLRFARAVAISTGEPQDVVIDPKARSWRGAKGRSGSPPMAKARAWCASSRTARPLAVACACSRTAPAGMSTCAG